MEQALTTIAFISSALFAVWILLVDPAAEDVHAGMDMTFLGGLLMVPVIIVILIGIVLLFPVIIGIILIGLLLYGLFLLVRWFLTRDRGEGVQDGSKKSRVMASLRRIEKGVKAIARSGPVRTVRERVKERGVRVRANIKKNAEKARKVYRDRVRKFQESPKTFKEKIARVREGTVKSARAVRQGMDRTITAGKERTQKLRERGARNSADQSKPVAKKSETKTENSAYATESIGHKKDSSYPNVSVVEKNNRGDVSHGADKIPGTASDHEHGSTQDSGGRNTSTFRSDSSGARSHDGRNTVNTESSQLKKNTANTSSSPENVREKREVVVPRHTVSQTNNKSDSSREQHTQVRQEHDHDHATSSESGRNRQSYLRSDSPDIRSGDHHEIQQSDDARTSGNRIDSGHAESQSEHRKNTKDSVAIRSSEALSDGEDTHRKNSQVRTSVQQDNRKTSNSVYSRNTTRSVDRDSIIVEDSKRREESRTNAVGKKYTEISASDSRDVRKSAVQENESGKQNRTQVGVISRKKDKVPVTPRNRFISWTKSIINRFQGKKVRNRLQQKRNATETDADMFSEEYLRNMRPIGWKTRTRMDETYRSEDQ